MTGRIELVHGDITRIEADAIVNAANSALRGGGGVDGAIHAAAGPSVMAELRTRHPGGTPTGTAVSTAAGELPARWIVHAVGPIWRGGSTGEAELLASAHRSSLDEAALLGAASVAFPAISCGIYGYPLERAAPVAIGAVRAWLARRPDASIQLVTFVLRSEEVYAAFEGALPSSTSADASRS